MNNRTTQEINILFQAAQDPKRVNKNHMLGLCCMFVILCATSCHALILTADAVVATACNALGLVCQGR